jgi:hypothetical protein
MFSKDLIQPKRIYVRGGNGPAIVDEDIFNEASSISWHIDSNGFARTNTIGRSSLSLAALALGVNPSVSHRIHHINGNKLDCRKRNLVLLDMSKLMGTKKLHRNNTSGFKGVSWNKRLNKWIANIYCGKKVSLGYFENKEDAARAYDAAALKYFGPYAKTNLVLGLYDDSGPILESDSDIENFMRGL